MLHLFLFDFVILQYLLTLYGISCRLLTRREMSFHACYKEIIYCEMLLDSTQDAILKIRQGVCCGDAATMLFYILS